MGQMTLLRVTPIRTLNFYPNSQSKYSSKLILDNISTLPIAFKIKTTAPKNYLVRPSAGILLTQQSKEIELLLERVPEGCDNLRDRFLIQAVPIDNDVKTLSKDFWTDIPRNVIQHHRLNVAFPESEAFSTQNSQAGQTPARARQVPDSMQTNITGNQLSAPDADLGPLNVLPISSHREPSTEKQEFNYDELLQYCIAVESKKKALAVELETANKQLKLLEEQLSEGVLCRSCHNKCTVITSQKEEKDGQPCSDVPQVFDTLGVSSLFLWRTTSIILFVFLILKFLWVF